MRVPVVLFRFNAETASTDIPNLMPDFRTVAATMTNPWTSIRRWPISTTPSPMC